MRVDRASGGGRQVQCARKLGREGTVMREIQVVGHSLNVSVLAASPGCPLPVDFRKRPVR